MRTPRVVGKTLTGVFVAFPRAATLMHDHTKPRSPRRRVRWLSPTLLAGHNHGDRHRVPFVGPCFVGPCVVGPCVVGPCAPRSWHAWCPPTIPHPNSWSAAHATARLFLPPGQPSRALPVTRRDPPSGGRTA